MAELERLIRSKFYFFKGTKHNCGDFFKELKEIQKGIVGKTSGYIKLDKSKVPVWYDSLYELKILKDLDKCYFVQEIKTQSLSIPYREDNIYYPDIQLLLNDGSLVVIEVKPFMEMVNKRNLWKRKALRKYCKKNGFAYAIIDQDYYSFDKDLVKENVTEELQMKFIKFVEEKGKVAPSDSDYKEFKEENNINDYQVCYIIWNNKTYLKYQQHTIIYRKKD